MTNHTALLTSTHNKRSIRATCLFRSDFNQNEAKINIFINHANAQFVHIYSRYANTILSIVSCIYIINIQKYHTPHVPQFQIYDVCKTTNIVLKSDDTLF